MLKLTLTFFPLNVEREFKNTARGRREKSGPKETPQAMRRAARELLAESEDLEYKKVNF